SKKLVDDFQFVTNDGKQKNGCPFRRADRRNEVPEHIREGCDAVIDIYICVRWFDGWLPVFSETCIRKPVSMVHLFQFGKCLIKQIITRSKTRPSYGNSVHLLMIRANVVLNDSNRIVQRR